MPIPTPRPPSDGDECAGCDVVSDEVVLCEALGERLCPDCHLRLCHARDCWEGDREPMHL